MVGSLLGRLNTAPSDLHAADAVYYHQCNINFSKKEKEIPKSQKTDDTRISRTPGRPKKSKIEQAFL